MDTPDTSLTAWVFVADGKPSRYPAEFLQEMQRREPFPNVSTGHDVKFTSLPREEQTKHYERWRGSHQQETPKQQLAPGIAQRMSKTHRVVLSEIARRGSLDLKEMARQLKTDTEKARKQLEHLEHAGYLHSDETERGHEYWVPTNLGYEIARNLRSQQPTKTSNMDTMDDWTFLAFHDPEEQNFHHPTTNKWIDFAELPLPEQMQLKQQLRQQQSQPQAVLSLEGPEDEGAPMATELEGRLSDYMGTLEELQAPAGLGVSPVSLGTLGDPMTRHEEPDTDADGERTALTLADPKTLTGPSRGLGEMEPEPAPPAQVRRMLQDRMRELGRGLMIAGAKAPRQQMMEIQETMIGLLDQLEALSDQPGREALRRRILLQLRPRVMRF